MVTALFTLAMLAAEISPGQQPQITSLGQNIALTFGAGDTIYYSGSTDQGATFSAPAVVARVPGLALGNHRGPRIALTSGAIVINAAVAPAGEAFAPGELWSWRSTDGGATWSAGTKVSPRPSGGLGFHAVVSNGKRRVWSAWIGPDGGHVKLFGASSDDEGQSWSKPSVIYQSPDGNVCECCHPSAAIGDKGQLLVIFRNSLAGARDLYLAVSRNDGQSFDMEKLGQGTWPLEACPMDGGGMTEFNGVVSTVWRRNRGLFLARPGGSAEEPVAQGKNPAIAAGAKGIYLVWSAAEGLMLRTPGKEARVLANSGSFPTMTGSGPVIAAWEDGGRIRVERLD